MSTLDGIHAARYELVTAAHHFILKGLPLRHPSSSAALEAFIDAASVIRLPRPDCEAVLLNLLIVIEPYTHGRLPSLVDRFLTLRDDIPYPLRRFDRCIKDVIRNAGVGAQHIQQAIAVVHERFVDSTLDLTTVARLVHRTPSALCAGFRQQSGLTFRQYLRTVRLDAAAAKLVQLTCSIKEVWAAVGYNHAANFNHDFRERFGVAPSKYRARGLQPRVEMITRHEPMAATESEIARTCKRILIVDDDIGTRETIRAVMRASGFVVEDVGSGLEGLSSVLSTPPHLILLDFHLPDMDGLAFLRALRQSRRGFQPAVIIFTADWQVEDHFEETRTLGATLLSKLCDLTELEELTASLCAAARRPQ